MKLTTLGCWGAYPYKDGGTTSYLVTSEDGFSIAYGLWKSRCHRISKKKSAHLTWMR